MSLFDPAQPRCAINMAVAELMALADDFRQQAAQASKETTIILYTRCAEVAEQRAQELRDGAPPHV